MPGQLNDNNKVDLEYLLTDNNCVHSIQIESAYFNTEDYKLFEKLLLCLYPKNYIGTCTDLDQTFNTLVNETISNEIFFEEIIKNHSLKAYVVDSLKRYHSLTDIIHILPSCRTVVTEKYTAQDKVVVTALIDILGKITKSILLTSTIESMSSESQRYFGNFIKKNDLPIPFAHFTWSKQRDTMEYKINFNTLAEIMCLTTDQYILHIGSESTMGMGKTSLLQFIFSNKHFETLTTDGSSTLRNGCIDVLFATNSKDQKTESSIIFDVHGTINAFNEDIITSIQEYCSFQIVYVTNEDLDSMFLNSIMNYSERTQIKPTIVIIFDSNYDNNYEQVDKVTEPFRSKYQNLKSITWITAPPEQLWNQRDSSKKYKDLMRSQFLVKSFNGSLKSVNVKTRQPRNCTSIFSIQSYYMEVKNLMNFYPPTDYKFEIVNNLDKLFQFLNDTTENLRIVTPISYLDSAIKQCENELMENWDNPQSSIQIKKDNLINQRSKITSINSYTSFFIELLTKRSYIELLITEKYLEKWRLRFEVTLLDQLTKAKEEALKITVRIKQLEVCLSAEENSNETSIKLRKELHNIESKYNEQHKLIIEINTKLMNIDLTIGLFCDEIMALYEFSPYLFDSNNIIKDIAKTLTNLMLKGFAIHILRGRPLRCHSILVKESIKFIETTQRPPLVLTVIGEQSSAKSSLMNTTFGCNFRVSAGRCTIGMYMSVIQWKSETIIIFDTEGLLSLEEAGSIFDNQMVTMAVLSSHLVLINHKGEFNSNLKDLIGMSFYAKLHIQSPIKPKLLFVLRDQVNIDSHTIFFRQLTLLKEQLQNDSKFLKISIDDELDISNQNVYLLPNAFSYHESKTSNITQCCRNKTFPKEIIQLRNEIFNNITSTTKPQKYQSSSNITNTNNTTQDAHPQTSTIDPAYTDMIHLYTKISSNWEAIERLGPQLLECKTLYELSIMKELQAIANDIIKEKNAIIYYEGESLIDQTLLNFTKTTVIDTNHDRIVEKFNDDLSLIVINSINQAHNSFNDKTQRSCYQPQMKSKVSRCMESPIRSAQYFLKQIFEERLDVLLRKLRVDDMQKQIFTLIQREFNQNKNIETNYIENCHSMLSQRIIQQYEKNLELSLETETTITEKILELYCSQLRVKRAESTAENIFNLLSFIKNNAEFQKCIAKFKNCFSQFQRNSYYETLIQSCGFWQAGKSFWSGPSDMYAAFLWTSFKDHIKWFANDGNESKNENLFADIWNSVVRNFERDLLNITDNVKTVPLNAKTVDYLFQYIENAINAQCIVNNHDHLLKHTICPDLATIGLNILINKAIRKEKDRHQLMLKEMTNKVKECEEIFLKQCNALKDSFNLGKTLAETVKTQIVNDIKHLLERRIEKDVNEYIIKNQFINHETIQKRAYEESFRQANGENILKYVYDNNRYFIELCLKEIRITLRTATYKHTSKFKHLIISAINKANYIVEQGNYQDTDTLIGTMRNAIVEIPDLKLKGSIDVELFEMFSLNNIVRMPIADENKFKQGFSHILDYYQPIQNQMADLIRNLRIKIFQRCKESIQQKLGCQARCPGCGAKCNKPEPHEVKQVKVWQDPCKRCSRNKCTCKRPEPISIKTHATAYHLAGAFHGWIVNGLRTPCLELCYQGWNTQSISVSKKNLSDNCNQKGGDNDDEVIFPKAKYYNQIYPSWYDDLDRHSMKGVACHDMNPPPDQRRAWMVVRRTLINHYKSTMIDFKEYNAKLYPSNIESLPEDFEPRWDDEDF